VGAGQSPVGRPSFGSSLPEGYGLPLPSPQGQHSHLRVVRFPCRTLWVTRGSGHRLREGVVEAPGIEPGSEAAFHATSTSVVPVLISPEPRPGTRLGSGQPRCLSRPAPRRHRAARLLALASDPTPAAEKPVDVRPKPELFSSLLLTQRGREVLYSHVYFSRFYEPGARLAFARPTTPSKPIRPHGNAASEISVLR